MNRKKMRRRNPKKKRTKAEKIALDMKRDKAFHENMCDNDGKEKLRFGSKMAGQTTHQRRKREAKRGKYS